MLTLLPRCHPVMISVEHVVSDTLAATIVQQFSFLTPQVRFLEVKITSVFVEEEMIDADYESAMAVSLSTSLLDMISSRRAPLPLVVLCIRELGEETRSIRLPELLFPSEGWPEDPLPFVLKAAALIPTLCYVALPQIPTTGLVKGPQWWRISRSENVTWLHPSTGTHLNAARIHPDDTLVSHGS